jgi:hypothetical protein
MGAVAALELAPEEGSMSAPALACERRVGELVIRVWDRGPEPDWHTDRTLFGPWARYRAELDEELGGGDAMGSTPWEAIYRLVANRRPELERRWPAREAVE